MNLFTKATIKAKIALSIKGVYKLDILEARKACDYIAAQYDYVGKSNLAEVFNDIDEHLEKLTLKDGLRITYPTYYGEDGKEVDEGEAVYSLQYGVVNDNEPKPNLTESLARHSKINGLKLDLHGAKEVCDYLVSKHSADMSCGLAQVYKNIKDELEQLSYEDGLVVKHALYHGEDGTILKAGETLHILQYEINDQLAEDALNGVSNELLDTLSEGEIRTRVRGYLDHQLIIHRRLYVSKGVINRYELNYRMRSAYARANGYYNDWLAHRQAKDNGNQY